MMVAVGNAFTVTVVIAEVDEQPVALVAVTLYVPAVVVLKPAQLPGCVAPDGTVHE